VAANNRQVEDVWLHWEAKNISFDTALGYHLFHLLTPGVAATIDAVRATSHPATVSWAISTRAATPTPPSRSG
jgi:hypothetical protein